MDQFPGSGPPQWQRARSAGESTGTLRDWEQARRSPDAAAMVYLKVIEREPKAVMRALNGVRED